jgi:hypothetical protein
MPLPSVLPCGSQTEASGHYNQIRQRFGLHLAHHLASMYLYGDFLDAEFATDLLIQ